MSTNTEHRATRGIPSLTDPEPPKRRKGWIAALAAFVVVIVVGLVAMLGSTSTDAPPATTPTTEVSPTTSTPTTEAENAAGDPRTVEIEVFDYGFAGFDTDLYTGDVLELFNSSESEYHSLIVIKFSDDYRVKTIEEVAALDPNDIYMNQVVDSFGRRLHAAPGTKAEGRIRLQTPGTYVALDWNPQNADPDAISRNINPSTGMMSSPPFGIEGGPLGYQHGMILEFVVAER
ncbi:MAG: hypothetical protein M3094_09610, partial [Actinomycetia bacterium]|nr:hypothetical protein [Actinomycetes bacterium]